MLRAATKGEPMIDPISLAAAASAAIAPHLPALISGAAGVVAGAQQELGADMWRGLKRIWEKLRSRPDAEAALGQVMDDPQDPDAEVFLRRHLKSVLQTDPDLAQEVADWVSRVQPATIATAQGDRSIAVGGGVTKSHLYTGDIETDARRPTP